MSRCLPKPWRWGPACHCCAELFTLLLFSCSLKCSCAWTAAACRRVSAPSTLHPSPLHPSPCLPSIHLLCIHPPCIRLSGPLCIYPLCVHSPCVSTPCIHPLSPPLHLSPWSPLHPSPLHPPVPIVSIPLASVPSIPPVPVRLCIRPPYVHPVASHPSPLSIPHVPPAPHVLHVPLVPASHLALSPALGIAGCWRS